MALRDGGEIVERGAVAVHTIKSFDGDPGPALMTGRAPGEDFRLNSVGVVVRGLDDFGSPGAHPIMGAGVDERVVDDKVAALGQRREQRIVRRKSAAEIERRLGADKSRGVGLQAFMFRGVAAQEA